MELIKQVTDLGAKSLKIKEQLTTEEATKNALVMPFINILGYDIFDPMEVVPEFIADVGIKKGEKVDYAILLDSEPIILIECKHWKEDLSKHHSQLLRYFHTIDVHFAILTNGIQYQFFTDLDKSNIMDDKPFFEINIEDFKDYQISDLLMFTKDKFNSEAIINSASNLRYSKGLTDFLKEEFTNPSEEFIKFLTKQVYSGVITKKVINQFKPVVKKLIPTIIKDMVDGKLHLALNPEVKDECVIEEEVENKIITTDEEIEGFHIIRSIVREKIDLSRIVMRDTQTYFGVLLDDNNRQPICRLHLNGNKKYLGLLDINKKEEKILIETILDIYNHSDKILNSLNIYL